MRNLLVLAALLAAAGRPSPACGFYAPRVFMVQQHYVLHAARNERTFVLADHRDVPDDGWSLLAPRSYDSTQIADAPASLPLELTLLGDGAPLAVTATRRVFLRGGFGDTTAMGAYEVDTAGKRFTIAVTGRHVDLAYTGLQAGTWNPSDAHWLAENHLAWTEAEVNHVGNVDTFTSFTNGQPQTAIRREGQLLGTYAGMPVGRLDADGQQFMLVDHDGDVRSIYL